MQLMRVDSELELCGSNGASIVTNDISHGEQTMKDMFLSPKMTPCRLARYSLVCQPTLGLFS